MMQHAKRLTFCAALITALLCVAPGCSYIFDFAECESNEECERFDAPEDGEFFVCSEEKCVLEPQRECREDTHCAAGQTCKNAQCTGNEG